MVGVGPAGTQQVVVVLTGPGGPLAPPALAARPGRPPGVDVAAVLVTTALPVDIRHNSKIDRVARRPVGRRSAAGRAGPSGPRAPMKVLVTGASGMTGRAVAPRAARPRATR